MKLRDDQVSVQLPHNSDSRIDEIEAKSIAVYNSQHFVPDSTEYFQLSAGSVHQQQIAVKLPLITLIKRSTFSIKFVYPFKVVLFKIRYLREKQT
ncbi:hypothetical protein CSV63_15870 [Sporosarcina sp. P34]|nr:hypothetical protein CSV63_15870 [Sporosarcina sp. P34]